MSTVITAVQSRIPHDLLPLLNRLTAGQRARILEEPSIHGSHRELFRDACAMTKAGIPDDEQHRILEARFGEYYRPIHEREIENAVRHSRSAGESSQRRYPAFDPGARERLTAGCSGALERLRAASPVSSPRSIPTSDIIDRFFDGDALLCLGQDPKRTRTEIRGYFRGLERGLPLMVPNPMGARLGLTMDNKLSNRCLSNVGPRVRLVLEYDTGSLDEQAALHLHFRDRNVPLQMVVFSGSKSLHGWFDVSQFSEDEVEKVCRYAALLGADRATFSRIQMVRTPNALRDGQNLQAVEFLA